MAYKARIVTCSSHAQLMKHVKEVMLAAGWINKTPSGQDDPNGYALGFFMNSPGESGNEDINLHMGLWYGSYIAQLPAVIAYLASSIDTVQDTITLASLDCYTGANLVTLTAPGIVQIDDELVYFTGTNPGEVQITGCIRGWGVTEPATHAAGAIAQLQFNNNLYCSSLQIETFAHSDLTKYLVASSGAATMTAIGPTSWATLTGFDDDRFNFHALVKVVGGTEDGKMRWIADYTSTGGAIAYQPFLAAPSAVNAQIISGGFFPAWSKRAAYTSGQVRYNGIVGTAGAVPVVQAGRVYFIYCSLDGITIVTKYTTYYDYFYAGNYIRPHAAVTTKSTAASLLTLSFGGTYTNCVMSDIGKPVVSGANDGVLVAFNNTSKIWYVAPTDPVDDPFTGAIAVTITGGTGQGTTTGSASRNGFKVDNVNIMIKDQKYRVLSQNTDDWDDNKTPGGSWPKLDPEETASEEFVSADVLPTTRLLQLSSTGYVSPAADVGKVVVGAATGDTAYLLSANDVLYQWTIIPIDSGDEFDIVEGLTISGGTGAGTTTGASTNSATGVVKSSTSFINTYLTGAVLGEDPRPLCRVAFGSDSNALYNAAFLWLTVFQPSKGTDLASNASNRQMHRAFHQSGNRYAPCLSYANSRARSSANKIIQGGSYAYYQDRTVDQMPYHLFQLTAGYASEVAYSENGSYNRILGFIPMLWALPIVAAGGVSGEDVVKTVWNGKYEKFRVFYDYDSGGTWFACGPEILV